MLELQGLSHTYGRWPALHDVSLSIRVGEMVCLLGPNGAGKSTLLRAASGLLRPSQGEVRWQGRPLRDMERSERARTVGFVPQQSAIDFPFSVREVVMMGRAPHQNLLGTASEQDRQVVSQVLAGLELTPLAERSVTALSGGEAQRALLATVLAQEPKLLVLDEPTSHLDPRFAVRVLRRLAACNKARGATVLWSMHDVNLAAWFAHRMVVLRGGRVLCEGHPREVMTPERLRAAFDVGMEVHQVRGVPQAWVDGEERDAI